MSNRKPAPGPPQPRKLPRRPASSLAEKWTRIDDVDVFYRESPRPSRDPRVMAHVHGFGLSGRYLLPTAEMLAEEFHTYVPDLPGFGRSGKRRDMLDIPDLARAAARLPRRSRRGEGDARRQFDGMPRHHRVRAPVPRADRPRRARLPRRWAVQSAAAPGDETALAGRPARAGQDGARRRSRLRPVRRAQHHAHVPLAHAVPVAPAAARDAHPDARRAGRSATRCCRTRTASMRSPARPTATCSS